MINVPVLVLNQNYQPLNVCTARRAIVLLSNGKAELLESGLRNPHLTPRHSYAFCNPPNVFDQEAYSAEKAVTQRSVHTRQLRIPALRA